MRSVHLNDYRLEVEGRFTDGKYNFEIYIYPKNEKPFLFTGQLIEEFVEDELDDSKNINYLGSILLKVATTHLKDILTLRPNTKIGDVKYWFRTAKKQLDQDQLDGSSN